MPILSIVLPTPPSDIDARELTLRFVPTRTEFVKIANATELESELGSVAFYAPSPVQVRVLFKHAVSSSVPLRIDLAFEGESPSDPEIEWEKSPSELVSELIFAATDAARTAVDVWKQRIDVDVTRQLDKIRQTRIDSIANETNRVLQQQKQYFCALDHATNPVFLSDRLFKRAIGQTSSLLMQRVILRRARAPELVPELQVNVPVLERLSELQIHIASTHLGDGTRIDVPLFEAAYVAFASGTLRQTGSWNGIPNSAFFFLFAEFAFHAIDAGVDAPIWLELLPALVHSQRLYVDAFPPYCEKVVPHQEVPIANRRFGTYMTQAETPIAVDRGAIDAVLTMIVRVRDHHGLLGEHAANALRAFPQTSAPVRPCNVLREPSTH